MMSAIQGRQNGSPFKATKIWNQLLSSFKEGMELKRKRWRLKSYDNCFSGAEALDWLHSYLQNQPTFGTNVTKEQAFMLLQKFLESNVFLHAAPVKNPKKFQDTNCLYKFEETDENKRENFPKVSKQEKENLPPQNSLSGVLKNFRRNSRNISTEDYQDTVLEEVAPESRLSEKQSENCMTPLARNLDNITVNSVEKGYADMSTILFDIEDDDYDDPFDTSISHFKRSNSLRVNNRYTDENHQAHITNLFSAKPSNNNQTHLQKKPTKKNVVLRKFSKGSPRLRDNSRRHTVTLGKRQADSGNVPECSPTKKMKKPIIRSDSNLGNPGHMTSLLPRKAVVMLGEKPSVIKGAKDGNILHLPTCKEAKKIPKVEPNKLKKHSKPSKLKSSDHKEAHLNPLLSHNPSNMSLKSKTQKQPPFVPMCSANDFPTSPILTAAKKKPSTFPSRRRSLSHNSLPLQVKSLSTYGLDSINGFNPLQKSKLHSSSITVNQGGLYKASSTWSINNIGLIDEASEMEHKNITHSSNNISAEDIEDAWKSVVILSLKKLLGVDSLSYYIDFKKINGDVIMKNCNWKTSELTQDAPKWLISAMQCLIEWPSTTSNTEDSVLQDLPNYPGFERDVYRTVKDHYQSSLLEPLIPCHMYPLLQECSEMMCVDVHAAINILQHVNVLLPCWNRRQLQLLVQFMHKVSANDELEISRDLPNKDLVIHSYYRLIARRTQQMIVLGCQDTIAVRVCAFLIEHYEDVFKPPSNLRVQVDHKIAVTLGAPSFVRVNETKNTADVQRPCSAEDRPRRLKKQTSFCVQISKEEYEREAKELSKQAIRDLLTSILNDKYVTEKERRKRLKQIQKAYPEIYSEQVSSGDDNSYCNSTISPQSMTESFKRAVKPSLLTEKML